MPETKHKIGDCIDCGYPVYRGQSHSHPMTDSKPVSQLVEHKCPKCGTVMCEKFSYKPLGRLTVSIPTGTFICRKCGYCD